MRTLYVVTLESDLLENLLFKFAEWLKCTVFAFAWNRKILRKQRGLPLRKTRSANISLA